MVFLLRIRYNGRSTYPSWKMTIAAMSTIPSVEPLPMGWCALETPRMEVSVPVLETMEVSGDQLLLSWLQTIQTLATLTLNNNKNSFKCPGYYCSWNKLNLWTCPSRSSDSEAGVNGSRDSRGNRLLGHVWRKEVSRRVHESHLCHGLDRGEHVCPIVLSMKWSRAPSPFHHF